MTSIDKTHEFFFRWGGGGYQIGPKLRVLPICQGHIISFP